MVDTANINIRKIYDVDDNLIENPDLEAGKLVTEYKPVTYKYEVSVEEEGHWETIAEYPNGGKDIEWVVDVPEEGAWTAYDENGETVDTGVVVPEDMPHETPFNETYSYERYILYTEEELAEIEERKRLEEEARAKAAKREEFLTDAPERMDTTETNVAEVQSQINALTSAFDA